MRPRFILSICICMWLMVAGQQASGQYAFVPRDYPLLYYKLNWNSSQQTWDSTYRYLCDYDVNGRLLRQEQQSRGAGGAWSNFYLTEYAYTFQPDSTLRYDYYWDGAAWVRNHLTIRIQDSLGRTTHDLRYEGSTAWVQVAGTRITYLPGLNGSLEDVLLEDYNGQTAAWDTTQSTHLVYGASSTPDTVLYAYYSNGNWYPDYRDVDVQWQNFDRFKAKYYVRQHWVNNQYNNQNRATCAFGPYEYRRCTTEMWDGSAWMPYVRDKHLQDSAGHFTDIGNELYNSPGWTIGGWTHYDHTYIAGKLAETVENYWNPNTQQLFQNAKYVFMDHTVEVAPPASGSPLIAFPVPARDRLYVRADLRGPLRLHVYDLQGRLLLTQNSDADHLQAAGIDISQVPSGLYLLHIEAARTRHALRIQVQH